MSHTKLFVRIGIGVAAALLLAFALWVSNMAGELNSTRQGIEEGFELRGTYQRERPAGGIDTIAFQTFDGERTWGASDGLGASAKGTFEGTADPNCYLLEDEAGSEVGWAHLAYANNAGEGVLYVRFEAGEVVELRKVDRIPSYLER